MNQITLNVFLTPLIDIGMHPITESEQITTRQGKVAECKRHFICSETSKITTISREYFLAILKLIIQIDGSDWSGWISPFLGILARGRQWKQIQRGQLQIEPMWLERNEGRGKMKSPTPVWVNNRNIPGRRWISQSNFSHNGKPRSPHEARNHSVSFAVLCVSVNCAWN